MGFDIFSMVKNKPAQKLTRLEFLVLLTLKRKALHGYAIMKKLKQKMPGLWDVKSGSLYPLLKRMTEKGFIRKESKRNRTKYSLTPSGRESVDQYLQTWKQMYLLFREMNKL